MLQNRLYPAGSGQASGAQNPDQCLLLLMPRLVTSDVLAEREAALAAAGEASPMSPLSFVPTATNHCAMLLMKCLGCNDLLTGTR